MAKTTDLVSYLTNHYEVASFSDISLNGLQFEGAPECVRVGAAVDGALAVIETAANYQVDFLLVHHGMFWKTPLPVVGAHREKLEKLFACNMNLFALHLPLDGHIEDGNSALLAQKFELKVVASAFPYNGSCIGVLAENPAGRTIEDLERSAKELQGVGQIVVLPFGPKVPERIGIVTGAGADALFEAATYGFDTLITGEPKQAAYHFAKEQGLNLIAAGHYATETFGVQRAAERLRDAFGLDVVFVDYPTGI